MARGTLPRRRLFDDGAFVGGGVLCYLVLRKTLLLLIAGVGLVPQIKTNLSKKTLPHQSVIAVNDWAFREALFGEL